MLLQFHSWLWKPGASAAAGSNPIGDHNIFLPSVIGI
jgi:hypothetical protein